MRSRGASGLQRESHPLSWLGSPDDSPPALPRNFIGPCLLLLLRERRAHGYDLLARLPGVGMAWPQRNGRYADSGAVYRCLHGLEDDGLVRSNAEPPTGAAHRRVYDLTAAGRQELDRRAQAVNETSDALDAFVRRYGSGAPAKHLQLPPAAAVPQ